MAKSWYVYELVDPRNDQIFYVGKGCGDRMHQHGCASDKCNKKKTEKIREIGSNNVIRRKIAEFEDEQKAYKRESDRVIELFDTGHLTNISIATTITRKPNEPKLTLKECIQVLSDYGWLKGIESFSVPSKEIWMVYQATYKFLDIVVGWVEKWRSLGEEIPEYVMSRNVKLILETSSD